jgi:prepilin-type N-terminal cleavage/methylation domain-containing protein
MASHRGFTLLELVIVLVLIGVMTTYAVPQLSEWSSDQRVKGAAREIADAFAVARIEAIRTQRNQIVFVQGDASTLVLDDTDGDGVADAGEPTQSFPAPDDVALAATQASTPAPSDPDPLDAFDAGGISFVDLAGIVNTNAVLFLPSGVPVVFSTGPFAAGALGSGQGAVYVSNGRRDYAVVLNSLGGVRVVAWNLSTSAWND